MTHLEETLIELKKCGKSGYLVMTCLAILKDIEELKVYGGSELYFSKSGDNFKRDVLRLIKKGLK